MMLDVSEGFFHPPRGHSDLDSDVDSEEDPTSPLPAVYIEEDPTSSLPAISIDPSPNNLVAEINF